MKQLAVISILLLTLVSCTPSSQVKIAEGSLEATEVIISAEGNGRIVTFDATEGSQVKADQVIGQLDDQQLVLQRKQLLANKERIESQMPNVDVQIAPLKAQLEVAMTEQARVANLFEAKAASQKQVDDINAQVKSLSAQLAAQKLTLEQTVSSLTSESSALSFQIAQLDDQIAKCAIASPIDGTLLTKYAEVGELATMGKSLCKIADLAHMYLRAYITASQLSTLALGDTVKVMIDFGSSEERYYEGTITWISDKAEFTPKTVQTKDERASLVYAMKVSLVNDGYLKLGMYGAVVEGN